MGRLPRSARRAAGFIALLLALFVALASTAYAAGPLGSLSQLPSPNNCIESLGNLATPDCGTESTANLSGAQDVVVSPDGKNVYMVDAGAGSVSEFARRGDGSLAELAAPNDCIGVKRRSVSVRPRRLGSPRSGVWRSAREPIVSATASIGFVRGNWRRG